MKITNLMGIYNNKMRSTRKMDNCKNKQLNSKINNKLMDRDKQLKALTSKKTIKMLILV